MTPPLRILLAQLNTTVADVSGNVRKMREAIAQGAACGADLVVFPECATLGYPAKDLLERPAIIEENLRAIREIAEFTRGSGAPAAVLGFVDRNSARPGQGLFNGAAFIAGGEVVHVAHKVLLPTYDVFDEARYFDSGGEVRVFEFRGRRIALSICEDIWNDDLYFARRRYPRDPIQELAAQNPDLLLNVSASPYSLGKQESKREMLSHTAKRYALPLVHVNLVGANDDLVFNGGSLAFHADGEPAAALPEFEEAQALVEVGERGRVCVVKRGDAQEREWALAEPAAAGLPRLEALRRALVLGIRDYMRKCGFRGALVGLSGGIDSALVAALAAEAIGGANVLGVSMPSRYSSQGSKDDARDLAKNLGLAYKTIAIEGMFATALADLTPHFEGRPPDVTEENLQSRLRGLTLMALSNKFGHLLLTTGNKSEMAVGYATLYGDMCGGLAPIADLPKTLVYDLCRHMNATAAPRPLIPEATITKPPSAELRPDQKDTDSLPPYEILDPILNAFIEEARSAEEIAALGFDLALVRRVIRMVELAEYKRRQAPPVLKVTSRAFGSGWRLPLARAIPPRA